MFKFFKSKSKRESITSYRDLKNIYRYQEKKKTWYGRFFAIFSFKGLSFGRGLLKLMAIGYALAMLVGIALASYVLILRQSLPDVNSLRGYKYDLPSVIYDEDGEAVYEYFDKKRLLVDYDDISKLIKETVVASEDSRFYSHVGIDPIRIIKAMMVDIMEFSLTQGASTITQQTAKLYFLTSEKTIRRKIREALLALRLEDNYTKDEILGFYLNKAFFGRQSYGIGAAAKSYFDKDVQDLTIGESATLIGLLPAPSRYSPTFNMQAATDRRNIVLRLMKRHGYITDNEFSYQVSQPIVLKLNSHNFAKNTSYYTEEIRRYLVNRYGDNEVTRGGLKVYTTMDLTLQKKAQQALRTGLINIERRHGYRGALANSDDLSVDEQKRYQVTLDKNNRTIGSQVVGRVIYLSAEYVVVDLGGNALGLLSLEQTKWAQPYDPEYYFDPKEPLTNLTEVIKVDDYLALKLLSEEDKKNYPQDMIMISDDDGEGRGDNESDNEQNYFSVLLSPEPYHNGAILAVDLNNGHVLAMVGGYEFGKSHFNRAIQSRRQPGSAFKPFVYLTALQSGYTASSILEDSPVIFKNLNEGNAWIPKNYGVNFSGYLSFRDALVFSKNIPTIKLANDIGIKNILVTAKNLGIDVTDIPDDLSVSLGSGSVSLWEMVRAFSIIANRGTLVEPIFVLKVINSEQTLLEDSQATIEEGVIPTADAFIVSDILYDVNTRGTGRRTKSLGVPSAGKTGTTNDNNNAWYIGYISGMIVGVYIGNDDFNVSLGKYETGAHAALPIWLDFMESAKERVDVLEESIPEDITQVLVVPNTGKLYCSGDVESARLEYFKVGTEPKECTLVQQQVNIDKKDNDDQLDNEIEEERFEKSDEL
ncbi:MAG: PBP1A family penicillin-binding protein [SAR324 cluster bacterium]|nr:PBP1A family penicillin-binding protein [SAR324 cluster bacterium]